MDVLVVPIKGACVCLNPHADHGWRPSSVSVPPTPYPCPLIGHGQHRTAL